MGFLAPFIPQIIGAGGALAGKLFGGDDESRESSSNQTSTTQGNLTPSQSGLFEELIGSTRAGLSGPSTAEASFRGLRNQGISRINQATDSAGKRLETNLAGRGFGRSGLVASGKNELEASRVGAIGGLESSLIREIERAKRDEQATRFSQALSLINPLGQTTTSSGSSQTSVNSGFDPFQFLSPFLSTNAFGGGGGGGGGGTPRIDGGLVDT